MFIVLFIRNKATLSSLMCLFKDLAYFSWRGNFKNYYINFQKKKMNFRKKECKAWKKPCYLEK